MSQVSAQSLNNIHAQPNPLPAYQTHPTACVSLRAKE